MSLFTDVLSFEECQKIAEKVTNSKNCEVLEYKVDQYGGAGGFQGEYFGVNLRIKNDGIEETTKLFLKTLPRTNRTLLNVAIKGYEKEEFIYCKLYKEFSDLGLSHLLDFVPKCYYARHRNALVLEDLVERGYYSPNSLESADTTTIQTVLYNLAKLHAASILYEDKKSKLSGKPYRIFDDHSNYLKANEAEVHKVGARMIYEYALEKFPDIPKKISMDEFKLKTKEAMNSLFDVHFKPSQKYKNVLIHGDTWLNNILVKKDADGKVRSCCLIDFQMSKYCPPLMDVLLLFYTSTDRKSRQTYMKAWLNKYYEYLSNILKNHEIHINTIYDRSTYRACCKYLNAAAICQALCFGQMIYVPSEIWPILHANEPKSNHFFIVDRTDFFEEQNILNCEPLRTRMKELLEDLCEDFENNV